VKQQHISVEKSPKRTVLTTSYFNEIKDIPAKPIALITYGGQNSEDWGLNSYKHPREEHRGELNLKKCSGPHLSLKCDALVMNEAI